MRSCQLTNLRRIGNVLTILLGFSATALLGQDAQFPTGPITPIQPASEALRDAERYRAERQASAHDVIAVSPAFSVIGDRQTDLYLLNLITEPLFVDIAVRTGSGEVLPLSRVLIEPNRHLVLALADLLTAAEPRFREGSLWLSYVGDVDSIQAWAIHRRNSEVLAVPFSKPESAKLSSATSFWSLEGQEGSRARYYLLNSGNVPIAYVVTMNDSEKRAQLVEGRLEPGERHVLSVAEHGGAQRGWLTVEHNAAPGDLSLTGFLEGPNTLLALPLLSPAKIDRGEALHGIRVPATASEPLANRATTLVLFNASAAHHEVAAELFALETGRSLARVIVRLSPWEVRSIGWLELFGSEHLSSADTRITLDTTKPLGAYAYQQLRDGSLFDIAFFSNSELHGSGSYPLPPLDAHEVVTTVVNLGPKPASLLGQYFWEGGTYAVGPLQLLPGEAYRFDPRETALTGEPDVLGRKLPLDYSFGYFKWLAQAGYASLVGRTEVRPLSGIDVFGFNCFGCCWDIPSGAIIPNLAEFDPGLVVPFDSCISYSTCNGVMGPYPYNPATWTSPAPFTWNTRTLSASGPGQETFRSEGTEFEHKINCTTRQRQVVGTGTGSTCKILLRKSHNMAQSWSAVLACTQQVGDRPAGTARCNSCLECCDKQKIFNECRKKNPLIVQAEHQTCVTHCQTDHCL